MRLHGKHWSSLIILKISRGLCKMRCVCVRVSERESDREREREGERKGD